MRFEQEVSLVIMSLLPIDLPKILTLQKLEHPVLIGTNSIKRCPIVVKFWLELRLFVVSLYSKDLLRKDQDISLNFMNSIREEGLWENSTFNAHVHGFH